ncbi:MAG: DUF2784 domain-containing protein [Desulfuromonadales bacterium]|nr:DUF2784 domain-containing protein [Desulfuromonadales bacterium]
MIAGIAADLLIIVHFAFIAFVVLGGLLVLKWGKVSILHIPCALWGALIEFRGWICPLTPLECHFREAAGGAGYTGGFINHYVLPLVYPEGLTRGMQISLGIIVLVVNLCVYGLVLVNRANGKERDA